MARLVGCPVCEGAVSTFANFCPHCGETNPFDFTLRETCIDCKGKGYLYKEVNYLLFKGSKVTGCEKCESTGKMERWVSGFYFEYAGKDKKS